MNKKQTLLLGLGTTSIISIPTILTISCTPTIQGTVNEIANSIQKENYLATNIGANYSPEQIIDLCTTPGGAVSENELWTYITKPNLEGSHSIIKVDSIFAFKKGQIIHDNKNPHNDTNNNGQNMNGLVAKNSFIRVYYIIKKGNKESSLKFFDVNSGFADYQAIVLEAQQKAQEPNGLPLGLTLKGKRNLPNVVNNTNAREYIDGLGPASNPDNQPVIEVVDNGVTVSKEGEATLILKYVIKSTLNAGKKDEKVYTYTSNPFTKVVKGFLTVAGYNQQCVDEKAEEIKQRTNLSIKSNVKDMLASSVNPKNLKDYVENLPTLTSNQENQGMQIEVVRTVPVGDQQTSLSVAFQVVQKGAKSIEILKEVNGFIPPDQKNIIEVNKYAESSSWRLDPTSNSSSIFPEQVTLDNIKDYVTGFPQPKDGIEVSVKRVVSKGVDSGSILVDVYFKKGGAEAWRQKEVNGFRVLTKEEKFQIKVNNDIKKLTPTNEAGNVTAWYVNKDTVKKYVQGYEEYEKYIDWNLATFTPNETETELMIEFVVKKDSLIAVLKRKVIGFLSKVNEAQNHFSTLQTILTDLKTKDESNTKKLETYTFYKNGKDNLNYLKKYFNIPDERRGVSIKYKIDYSETDKSLSTTQLKFTWTLTNEFLDEKNNPLNYTKQIVITNVFDNFKNPYQEIYDTFTPGEWKILLRENDDNTGSIISGTWQTTWAAWGKRVWLEHYLSNNSQWAWKEKLAREIVIKKILGGNYYNFNLKFVSSTNADSIRYYTSTRSGISWVIGCRQDYVVDFEKEGYKKIQIKYSVLYEMKNEYWKGGSGTEPNSGKHLL